MAVINPEWVTKEVGSFQTAEEMNTLATAVKNNAVELQTDITNLSTHVNNKSNPHEVTKAQLNLENVDNVSDANKPVSIAQAEAIAVVQTDIDNHEANLSNPHEVTKAQVGLSEVDNTSDLNKPISIAQQTAINAASTTFNNHVNDTDNPHDVTKIQLGLSNVDNTSDLAKPISTATQNALATKENISNKGIAGGYAGLDANGKVPENQLPSSTNDVLEYISFSYFPPIGEFGKIYIAKDTNKLYRWEDSTYIYIKSGAVDSVAGKVGIVTLDKNDVGLPNVDNTSDMDKPISNAQNIAFNDLRDDINGHEARTDNPHSVTKAQIGLSAVDNTSDANKPISLATQTALNLKADKTRQVIAGSGLTGGGDLSADRTINIAATDDSIVVAADGIKVDTQNLLTSTSVTKPLAANQGTILDGKITQVGADLNTLSSDVTEIKKWNTRVYGVEFTKGQLDPVPTRWIGDTSYKTNHYIYEQFKVAKVKAGVVIGYLNQTNWNFMEDGTASGIVIDGTTVTDDGADIMLVNPNPFYAILGGTHATLERRLVADTPFSYDGDAAILIPAFGVCVDFSVIKSGVQRSIRDNTLVGSGAAGIGGLSYLADGKGCPKAETSRFNYELYARAKNTDNTKNVPYANAFQLDLNVWFTLLCIKFQTKDLHATSVLGKCISSNDSAPTVANWGTMTGVRVTNADASYSYYNISSSRFGATGTTTTKNFFELINNYRPLLKMFEMQLALSYAKANSVAEGIDFTYDGSTYNYVNIAGHKNITTGEMTSKIRKKVQFSFSGYDSVVAGEVTGRIIDVVFEQAIVKGKIAGWGNCWQWVSGIDAVCDNTGTLNNQYTFYQTNDVTKLTTDTDSTDKVAGVTFNFEKIYNKIGVLANTGGNTNNYSKQNNNNSIVPLTLGTAGLHTGECQYIYMGSATSGYRTRKGVYFGGSAHYGACALRYSPANTSPTYTYTTIAGGFRVAL